MPEIMACAREEDAVSLSLAGNEETSGERTAQFECVPADVIVGVYRGAALVAQRVALPAVVGLVERHLVRVGVRVRIRN